MTLTSDAWPAGATATMNVTYTQANAAGGAVVCEISPGAGQEFIVLMYKAVNSGTHGIDVKVETAVGGTEFGLLQSVASGAGTSARGSVGLVSVTATSANQTGLGYPVIISGSQALSFTNTGAGAQNDTFQVLINVRVKTGSMPTVTHANSTNAANVSVTAGAESFTTV